MSSSLFPDSRLEAPSSLAGLGFQIVRLFQRIRSDKNPDGWPTVLFADEADRFELWAVNLGLFVVGHGSLDYRVREADSLSLTIRRFLQELLDSLEEVIQLRASDAAKGQGCHAEPADGDADSEDDDDDDDDESPIDLLLDGVRDPIKRLYAVSTRIRNPSSRLASSRAATYQHVDEETGVDFLRVVEQADYDHIQSLFLQYQKSRALQEHMPSEPPRDAGVGEHAEDHVWEPLRSVLSQHGTSESFLVRRIARANVRRRQQFAYWKKHRESLAVHARTSISVQGGLLREDEMPSRPSAGRQASDDKSALQDEPTPPALSVTTASNLNMAMLQLSDSRSTFTVSEYAPSTWQPARDAVVFPPPPREPDTGLFFECPYCFTICHKDTLSNKAWKAHLIHDLRPYVCTYESCANPGQLYDNRQDWAHHENSCHRKAWRCPEHSNRVFTELQAYRGHLRDQHSAHSDDNSSQYIINASECIMSDVDRPCPVCSTVPKTARELQSHIALHLERFALFSLPRSIPSDGDVISHADSDVAIGTIEGSRDDDFEGDLDIQSEGCGADAEGGQKEIEDSVDKSSLTEGSIHSASKGGMAAAGRMAKVFEDHNSPVYGVAFSPDGQLLASVSDDKVVRLWNLETGTSRPLLEGHRMGFRSLAWSRDGKTIASGSYDKTTKLWDASTGKLLRTLSAHGAAVSGLCFSSDSKLIVSASHDKTCKLWDVDTGTLRSTLAAHSVGVWSVAISPDDKYIVSGSNDRTVKIWDLATGALVRTLKGHRRVIYAVAVAPDGRTLATGSNDWTIKIWDMASGTLLHSLGGHEKGITALAFSPDGSLLASAGYDPAMRIWDVASWTTAGVLESPSEHYTLAFSRDGKQIASGSRDKKVRIWHLNLGQPVPSTP